jgi:hypothetical protein
MLQNRPVQRLKGGNPSTGLHSRRLITQPRELLLSGLDEKTRRRETFISFSILVWECI